MVALGARHAMQIFLPTEGDFVETYSQAVLDSAPASFVLIGHGLGGAVALDVLRRAPERVQRIVLMATDPLSEPPNTAVARETRIVAARAGRLVQAIREEFPADSFADTEWRDDVLNVVQDMALGLGEGVFIRQSRALQRRPDQQKTMRRTKVQALILAGEHDLIVPLRRQEFTAGLMPYGNLQVIAGAGHLPSLEQPDAVTDAITAFLNAPLLLR